MARDRIRPEDRREIDESELEREVETDEHTRHPALKNFNRTAFQIKHVIGKALKFAAIGAVALGVGALVGSFLFAGTWPGMFVTGASIVKGWLGYTSTGERGLFSGATELLGSGVATGLTWGGVGGLAIGLVSGFSSSGEAADEEEERLIARYEQREARQERTQAIAMRRDQQRGMMMQQEQEMGLSPAAMRGRPRMGREQAEGIS